MKKKSKILLILIAVVLTAVQCSDDVINDSFEVVEKSGKKMPDLRTTGTVQVFWESGGQKNVTENEANFREAVFQFDAHQVQNERDSIGEIILQVFEVDLTLHREIKATVQEVLIDPAQKKAWFTGMVYYDSKSGESEHDDHEEGGCDHEDGEECSHDDGEECGGSDGGCSHDDGADSSHDDGEGCDGGCSHDDEESCEGGSEGGTGGSSGKLSGKNSRVGQLIAVKVHDGGTPGAGNDGITWKWFSSDGTFTPSAENISQWPHLCKKTIVEGNLVVHSK